MFRFEHPEFLIAFAVLPVLIGLIILLRWSTTRMRARIATPGAWKRLMSGLSPRLEFLKYAMLITAFALLCMSLVNPQWGTRRETVQAKSADIFIALDISNSMLAQDIAPSRLDRAKRFAQNLIQAYRGERIGLILFAGSAYLQMPLTSDYAAAELFVRTAHPRLATTQGTAIGEAIDLAVRAYEEDEAHHKALVIITDGENHEEGALESMQRGSDLGLVPFVIAVGSAEGGFIPMNIQGREDYKRDESGNPVRTVVNTEFMTELASAGGGVVYQLFSDQEILDDMRSKIDGLEKRDMEQRAFKDYESYYQYFLFAALILFFGEWLIGRKRFKRKV